MLLKAAVLLYLSVLSIFDIKERAVPRLGLWIGGGAALAYRLYLCISGKQPPGWGLESLIQAAVPGAVMLAAACATKKAGCADGAALLILGAVLPPGQCMLVFVFSLMFISLFSGGLLILRRGNRNTAVPYLPFLTAAYVAESILSGT